ncbi:OsmC family protein [Novosphingobium profundi]|uniref:OsmC family protein n=1 Tax=Novosphingobium profundi TaxID=1774954 RepID=UPI001BDB670E|nr:OsmC family protein [Novosphingobium profundi]MBT0668651.1 OsmC family protein [Novosphingobium profundi]
MARKTRATIADAQGSALAVAIEVSGHHLFGDEPHSAGGNDLGPNPFDLLTSALGACTAITVRWYARQQGWPLEHVNVSVEHVKRQAAGDEVAHDSFVKTVAITGSLLSPDQRRRLLEVADKCPVHKTLTGDIRIATLPA